MANRWETMDMVIDFIFWGSKITADSDWSHEIKRHLLLGRKAMTNLDSILKSRDIANKGPSTQSCGFSSSHIWTWELDHKKKPSAKEFMLLNCGIGKDSWESLGQQGDPTSQSWRKSVLNIHLKWDSHFLGRLIRSLGVPDERGVWNSQGGRKDKLFSLSTFLRII